MNIQLSTGKQIEVTPQELSEIASVIHGVKQEVATEANQQDVRFRRNPSMPEFYSKTVAK